MSEEVEKCIIDYLAKFLHFMFHFQLCYSTITGNRNKHILKLNGVLEKQWFRLQLML